MRTMLDSVNAANIPTTATMVAGYCDAAPGYRPWSEADWARWPSSTVKVRIATQPATDDGHVADVELGDMNAGQAVDWCVRRRARGVHPTVYVSEAAWHDTARVFDTRGVPQPEWWIAGYPGSVGAGNLYPGSVAHQYKDTGPFDVSAVADYWPGVDDGPVPPPFVGSDEMPIIREVKADGTFAYWWPAGAALVKLSDGEAYEWLVNRRLPYVDSPTYGLVSLGQRMAAANGYPFPIPHHG